MSTAATLDRPDFAATVPQPYQATAAASPADLIRGRQMQCSLKALLDRVPRSRAGLPHLAALEVGLAEQGTGFVQTVSHKGLAKMHTQLRVLPLDPADGCIQDLVALVQRGLRHHAREQRTHQLSPHDPQSTVVITESSESDFINALNEARNPSAAR